MKDWSNSEKKISMVLSLKLIDCTVFYRTTFFWKKSINMGEISVYAANKLSNNQSLEHFKPFHANELRKVWKVQKIVVLEYGVGIFCISL